MLKRPRLPSPPLSQEDPQLPIPIDTPSSLLHTKRRRTLGPIIDSHERENSCLPDDDDDDGEDNILETDIEGNGLEASDVVLQEYEHVNGFLHKLHFQKQRFNPTSSRADSHANCQSLGKKNSKGSVLLPNVLREDTPQSGESALQNTGRCGDDKAREQRVEDGFQSQAEARPVPLDLKEERQSVANNYEDSNRMLGSLVLSRRLHLRSSSYDARS